MSIEPNLDREELRRANAIIEGAGAQVLGADAAQIEDLMSQLGFRTTHPAFFLHAPMVGYVIGAYIDLLTADEFARTVDIALKTFHADRKADLDDVALLAATLRTKLAKGHDPECIQPCDDAEDLAHAMLTQLMAFIYAFSVSHRELGQIEDRQIDDDIRQLFAFIAKGIYGTVSMFSASRSE